MRSSTVQTTTFESFSTSCVRSARAKRSRNQQPREHQRSASWAFKSRRTCPAPPVDASGTSNRASGKQRVERPARARAAAAAALPAAAAAAPAEPPLPPPARRGCDLVERPPVAAARRSSPGDKRPGRSGSPHQQTACPFLEHSLHCEARRLGLGKVKRSSAATTCPSST
jgi:hypothetical protein